MRLLYIQQLLMLPGTPGNHRSWEFARFWQEKGWDITILASDALIPADHPLRSNWRPGQSRTWMGVEVYLIHEDYGHEMSFWRRSIAFAGFAWKAWKLGKRLGGFDAVLAYSAPPSSGEVGLRLANRWKIPFFFEVADVWPDVPIGMGILRRGPMAGLINRRVERLYHQARMIFPFSPGMGDQISGHGISNEKIKVSFNGVAQEAFKAQVRPRGKKGLNLLYTGTVGIANDLTQFLSAMRKLQDAGREDIKLTILGSGNDLHRVWNYARTHQLKNVDFLGQVPREEALTQLGQADAGVVSFATYPVLEANSATKFYDYLAAGLPVLINYRGWQADFLMKYRCGLSADQGNIDQLAQNILTLADDPGLRFEMGQNGRAIAISHFDRRKLAQQMLDWMEEASTL